MQRLEGSSRWLELPGQCVENSALQYRAGTTAEAQKIVSNHPDRYTGYLMRSDTPGGFFLCLAGSELFAGGDQWTAYVYRTAALPKTNLFKDDFTDKTGETTRRPGRGEGLYDDVAALCLFGLPVSASAAADAGTAVLPGAAAGAMA